MTTFFRVAVLGALAVVALVPAGCASGPAAPTTVQGLAEQVVSAAKALDATAGARLLCSAPSTNDYDTLRKSYLDPVTKAIGTRLPEVDYAISDVVDSAGVGSFVLTISTTEAKLAGSRARLTIPVEVQNGHSCVAKLFSNSAGDYADFRVQN